MKRDTMNLKTWTLDQLRDSANTLRERFKLGNGENTDLRLLNLIEAEINFRHGWTKK
jgi:hypothetical protein